MKLANGFVLLALGLMLGGCVEATLEPAPETSLKPRDRELLAHAPYAQASIPEAYRRHIVDYHRKEAAGTIVVETDARGLLHSRPPNSATTPRGAGGRPPPSWSVPTRVFSTPGSQTGAPSAAAGRWASRRRSGREPARRYRPR